MRLRRGWFWYALAAVYIAVALSAMPAIERFFSPFPFHVWHGPM